MNTETVYKFGTIVGGLAALSLGYLLLGQISKNRALADQMSEIRAKLAQYEQALEMSHPTNGFNPQPPAAVHAGTPDATDEFAALQERRMRGDYLLELDPPHMRRRAENFVAKAVEAEASKNAVEYSRIFGELGISQEIIPQLQQHISQIHKASLEAEIHIQQVLLARNAFKTRLESMLSPEEISAFRAYEESKRAYREVSDLQSFAQERNFAMDPQHQHVLTELIQQAQAYSNKSCHGPLDGLPEITVGDEMVISQMKQEMAQIADSANTLYGLAQERSLPEEYISLLQNYFDTKLRNKERTVDNIVNWVPPPRPVPRQLQSSPAN